MARKVAMKKKKPAARKMSPKQAAVKKPKKKSGSKRTSPISNDAAAVREELAEARAELARIAGEENHARRDLEAQVSAARSIEDRLRNELEAMRVDLRTALADLEIARADHARAEGKLLDTMRELQSERVNERLAAHASADIRDRMLDLEREIERLNRELTEALGRAGAA
jgi:hypothetical protein